MVFTSVTNKGYYVRLIVNQTSQNIANNTSTVSWELWVGNGVDTMQYNGQQLSASINGKTVYSATQQITLLSKNMTVKIASGTETISHNADGTKTIACSGQWIPTGAYAPSATLTASGSLPLTTIPRASSVSLASSEVAYGSRLTINISRATSSFTHDITITLPNRTQTYTGVATQQLFDIPLDWLNGYTNGLRASGTVTVQTKSGSTNIGSAVSVNFASPVPSNIAPTVSIARTAFNSGLAGFNEPIQGISTMTLTRTAGGTYGSTITKTEWWGEGINPSSSSAVSFTAMQKNPQYIYCKVTDSRGRTGQVTYISWNHDYTPPSIDGLEFYRCNSNGVSTQDGTYIMFKPSFNFTSLSGINKLTRREQIDCSPAYDFSAITPASTSGIWLGPTGVGRLAITNSYTFVFTITDSIGKSAKRTVTIPVSEVLMNFPATADSVAFGQYSNKSKTFQVGWDAEFNGNIIGSLNIPQSTSQSPTRNGSGLKVNNQPIPITIGYGLSKDLVVGKPALGSTWGHESIKNNPTAGGADIGLVDPGTEAPLSNQKINMVYSGLGLDTVVNFAIDGEFYFNEALDKAIGCIVITTAAGVAYRFTNGLMICIANRSFTNIVYSAVSGGYESPYQVWSFPHAFNSTPAVIVNGDVGGQGWYEGFWSDTQDGSKVHYGWTCKSSAAPPSSNVTKVQLVAIGNWKTPDF